jgi:dGTPase
LLGLNLDLIEAIALGHDIGHTPFGHRGESLLDNIYHKRTGKHYRHNLQSVRILEIIYKSNLTLQTLNGILCHNGLKDSEVFKCAELRGFAEFDVALGACTLDPKRISQLQPGTLEGCVVRVSDIIAYIGRDRDDAGKAGYKPENIYSSELLGYSTREIIGNLISNIVKNSLNKDYIAFDTDYFHEFVRLRRENDIHIYSNSEISIAYDNALMNMMSNIYDKLLDEYRSKSEDCIFYKHYIHNISYRATEDELAADFISSMTDDYFIDLHRYWFPKDPLNDKVCYIPYFK